MTARLAAPLQRLVAFYETLTPATLKGIRDVYAHDAALRDPFNDVHGVEEVQRVLGHMFEHLDEPRFFIREAVADADGAFLIWDFHFRMKRFKPERAQQIHGASHIRFDAAGKVSYHRDYWDAAAEVYEKLPVLGAVLRALRKRMQ